MAKGGAQGLRRFTTRRRRNQAIQMKMKRIQGALFAEEIEEVIVLVVLQPPNQHLRHLPNHFHFRLSIICLVRGLQPSGGTRYPVALEPSVLYAIIQKQAARHARTNVTVQDVPSGLGLNTTNWTRNDHMAVKCSSFRQVSCERGVCIRCLLAHPPEEKLCRGTTGLYYCFSAPAQTMMMN